MTPRDLWRRLRDALPASPAPEPVRPPQMVCSRCGVRSTPSEYGICVEVNPDAVAVEEFLRMDLLMARSGL